MQTVDVVVTQLGVREATGKNDGVPAARYNGGEILPWCASLILWANARSDDTPIARTVVERYEFRAVSAMEKAFMVRGWWLPPSARPRANDLVFFSDRGTSDAGTGNGQRHVGIVESVTTTHIHTVEGNVSNQCLRLSHDLASPRITGFGRLPPKA